MKILVACEESQAVTKELRELGHEAYSCDVQECSGGHPEWHLQKDVFEVLKDDWDMMIAFPPCTHLSLSGAKHFKGKREDGRQREGIEFFMKLWRVNIDKVAIENPMNIMGGKYIQKHFPDLCEKYDFPVKKTQVIQPYQFGDEAQKTTWLWIKGLPELTPTNLVGKGDFYISPNGKKIPAWYNGNSNKRNKRSTSRSQTFPGIAKAMALQWGGVAYDVF